MKGLVYLFFFFITGISAFAQTSLKKAEQAYQETNYPEAVKYYHEFLNSSQYQYFQKSTIYYHLAKSYCELGFYQKAGEYFRQVLTEQINESLFYYDYAQWFKITGNYLQAIEYYNLFAKKLPEQTDITNAGITSCLFALSFSSENKFAHCIQQPDVSTIGEEKSITFYNDTLLYLTSLFAEDDNIAERFFVYKSSILKESFASPLLWQKNPIPKKGISNITVNELLHQLFYTLQKSGKTELYIVSLDTEKKQSSKKIMVLETLINGISSNKNGNRLYFSAKLKNGFGGYDIWYIEQENDQWSEPINAGTLINTSKNEITPFSWNDSVLFFSSDGQPENFGGFDIYSSLYADDEFQKPENLKYPFNSSYNDIGLCLHSSSNFGALLSNRANDNMNIFRFDNLFSTHCYYGQVIEASSQKPILNANITVFDGDRKEWDIQTDEKGNYHFFIEKGEQYQVQIRKPNYFSSSFSINDSVFRNTNSFKLSSLKNVSLDFLTLDKQYELNNLFLHPLTTELSLSGKNQLLTIVEFLSGNPHLSIHFTSNMTSNNKEYGELVSTARIDSIIHFFVQNSISQTRISFNASVGTVSPKVKDSTTYTLFYQLFDSPIYSLGNDTSSKNELKHSPVKVVPSFKPVIYYVQIDTQEKSINEIRKILLEKKLNIKLISNDGEAEGYFFAGPFLIKSRALKIEEQLNAAGINAFIKEEIRDK